MAGIKRKRIRTIKLTNTAGDEKNVPAGNVVKARSFLISGNCHSLAAAIHEITGFTLIAFREINDPNSLVEHEPHIRHVAVVSPEWLILDGYGISPLDRVSLERNWKGELFGSVAELDAAIKYDSEKYDRNWLPLEPMRMASFALPIVAMYYSAE